MLYDIDGWMADLKEKLTAALPGRVLFLGLQGSYRRGEATSESDIDIVTILDQVRLVDLDLYRSIVRSMPEGEKACGFLCCKALLLQWPRFDLLSLFLDTKAYLGQLSDFIPPFAPHEVAQAVRIGASGLYHAAVHDYLYALDRNHALAQLSKSLYFLLRLRVYQERGVYCQRRTDLLPFLTSTQLELFPICADPASLLSLSQAKTSLLYEALILWVSQLMKT